jgi:hypothetical protein
MENRTKVILTYDPDLFDRKQHARKCTVCRHPEREAIEEAFLQWRKVYRIAREFNLPSHTTLYRHAHAFGLFARRDRNLRHALGFIIEQAETVTPTAESIIHAVKAYTRLNDAGEWNEPPAHVIVSSASALLARKNARPQTSPSPLAPNPSPLPLIGTDVESANAPSR